MATPQSIVKRNRANAQLSTGPKTAAGKSASKRNSLRHGMTSNPAAGTIEDRRRFKRLISVLREELEPGSVIEDLIVQRIAVAAWRLERCCLADSAIWDTAINNTPPARREVHDYIQEIMSFWRPDFVEDHESPDALRRKTHNLPPARHWIRHRLASLDRYRKDDLMRRGSGIMAMVAMINDLVGQLQVDPRSFTRFDAERFAWLLGEHAARLNPKEDDARFPGEYPRGNEIDRLILGAAKRDPSAPVSATLLREADRRLATLRVQSQTCEVPYADEAWQQRWRQSPFVGESVLERLMRYETNAERSLHKNLEALARLRGTSVETVMTRVRRQPDGGTELVLWGQQMQALPPTQSRPGG